MSPGALFPLAFCLVWGGALAAVDARSRRLPDYLTLPGAAACAAWALTCGRPAPLLGGLAWAGLYLVAGLLAPEGAVGGGDVKFALGLGVLAATAGPAGLLLAAAGSSVLTLLYCAAARATSAPHGPAMAAATALVLAGDLAAGAWG